MTKNILERIDEAFPEGWQIDSLKYDGYIMGYATNYGWDWIFPLKAKTLPALLKKIEREIKKRNK